MYDWGDAILINSKKGAVTEKRLTNAVPMYQIFSHRVLLTAVPFFELRQSCLYSSGPDSGHFKYLLLSSKKIFQARTHYVFLLQEIYCICYSVFLVEYNFVWITYKFIWGGERGIAFMMFVFFFTISCLWLSKF